RNDLDRMNLRLAAALLLRNGELSVADIQALPSVKTRDAALVIARELLREFDARQSIRPVAGRVVDSETFIELNSPPPRQRSEPVQAGMTREEFHTALRRVSRRTSGGAATG